MDAGDETDAAQAKRNAEARIGLDEVSRAEQWFAVMILFFAIGFVGDGIEKRLKEILGELRLMNHKSDNK